MKALKDNSFGNAEEIDKDYSDAMTGDGCKSMCE